MNLERYILDADGQPIPEPDLLTWAQWMGTGDHQVLAREQVGRFRVSTVFLGLDHNWIGGDLVLWETRVFGGKLDGETDRYTSKAEALKGHKCMVERVGEHA